MQNHGVAILRRIGALCRRRSPHHALQGRARVLHAEVEMTRLGLDEVGDLARHPKVAQEIVRLQGVLDVAGDSRYREDCQDGPRTQGVPVSGSGPPGRPVTGA